jgi:head-tail adaptor
LTCLVTLENPGDPVPDGEGGYTDGWTALSPPTMWARINAATQRDMEDAGAEVIIGQAMFTVEMYYHPQATLQTRLRYDDPDRGERTFQIVSLRDVEEARRELQIIAAELVTP